MDKKNDIHEGKLLAEFVGGKRVGCIKCELAGNAGDLLILLSTVCGGLIKSDVDVEDITDAVARGMAEAKNSKDIKDMPDDIKDLLKGLAHVINDIVED